MTYTDRIELTPREPVSGDDGMAHDGVGSDRAKLVSICALVTNGQQNILGGRSDESKAPSLGFG